MSQQNQRDYVDLALAVYVEDIVRDKDVLYVGRPDGAAASRLGKAARRVDLVAPDAGARGTRRGGRVRTRRWPEPDETGRWDVVIVPDLIDAGLASDRRIDELAGFLAPGGVLVVSAPEPNTPGASAEALSYEGLFDLLEGAFDAVRMLGQAPFQGWSVVDFAPVGELEVTFDGSLLEGSGEAAQRYVALCGDADVVLDPYAIVQIPAGASDPASDLPGADAVEAKLAEQQEVLDAAHEHAEELEKELAALASRLDEKKADVTAARKLADDSVAARKRADAACAKLKRELETLREAERGGGDEEFVRLETALLEAGRQLTVARAEVERRGVLVRDLIEELREARGEAPGAAPIASAAGFVAEDTLETPAAEVNGALQEQVSQAVERAISAEADKAELQFRLDEVRGQLAVAENDAVHELEALRRVEAALRGTVRGLNARLAEVTELHQINEARLALSEDDSRSGQERRVALERELAETRERLELEMARTAVVRDAQDPMRSPTLPPPQPEPGADLLAELAHLRGIESAAAAREGKLMGALAKCRDDATDVALQVRATRQRADAERAQLEQSMAGLKVGYERRIAEVVAELDQASGQADRALVRVGELEAMLQSKTQLEAALRGELSGVSLRLADREASVAALTVAAETAAAAEADGLGDEPFRAEETVRHGRPTGPPPAAPSEPPPELAAAEPTDSEATDSDPMQRSEPNAHASSDPRVVVAGREADGEGESELASARGEIVELRSEAETLRSEAEALRTETEALRSETEALRTETETLRTELARVQELDSAADADEAATNEAATNEATLRARDGLVARLQSQLVEAGERRRELEARLAEANGQLGSLHEEVDSARAVADVEVEEKGRELGELHTRLEQARAQEAAARGTLDEVKRMLSTLADTLPEASGAPTDAAESRRLRERLNQLDAEAADRDVLLRSLTAQLQERDDRIRGLERMQAGEAPLGEADALAAQLLEMQERVARLTEELEHERDARRRLEG